VGQVGISRCRYLPDSLALVLRIRHIMKVITTAIPLLRYAIILYTSMLFVTFACCFIWVSNLISHVEGVRK